MKKQILNANLIKKYHQDLVFNYSEYPTKDHWKFEFKNDEYKEAILDWFPKNQDKKIFYEGNISLVLDKYMGRTKHWIQQMEKNILTYPMGYSEKSGLDKTNELLLSQTLKPKKQE